MPKAKGLGEETQAALTSAETPRPKAPAASSAMSFKLKIGPGGRVVIPAEVRAAMGVKVGETLFASFDGEEIKAVTVATTVSRVQAAFKGLVPEGVSLADELIADRRREQEREDRGE